MIFYLVTQSYPFLDASEVTFLRQEVEILSGLLEEDDSIVLVPGYTSNRWESEENVFAPLVYFPRVKTDFSLLETRRSFQIRRRILVLMVSFTKLSFVLKRSPRAKHLPGIGVLQRFLLLARWADHYVVMKRALRSKRIAFNGDDVVCTWWLDGYTAGLVRSFKDKPNIKPILISRAHGGDLFDDQGPQICQKETLMGLSKVFPSTRAGFDYLTSLALHPRSVSISRLGTKDLRTPINSAQLNLVGPENEASSRISIVTISTTAPVKRLELLADHLRHLITDPGLDLTWCHFGQELSSSIVSSNSTMVDLKIEQYGWLSHEDLFRELKHRSEESRVIVVNYSSSEGTCMSLVESACLGYPLIGCAVGGIPEIVTRQTGVLLPNPPSSQELGEAIREILRNYSELSGGARRHWENEFEASKRYSEFWYEVRAIRAQQLINGE